VRVTTGNEPVDSITMPHDLVIRGGPDTYYGYRTLPFLNEGRTPVCAPRLARRTPLDRPDDLRVPTLLHAATFPRGWSDWLALAPVTMARTQLAEGSLTAPFPELVLPARGYCAYIPIDRFDAPEVAVFHAWRQRIGAGTRSGRGGGMPVAGTAMMGRRDRLDRTAVSMLVVCCAIWGLQQVTIKLASAGISPVLQAGIRSAIALVCIVAWASRRRVPLFGRDGTLWPGIAAGLLFALEFVCIYLGLRYTTAARSVVFLFTSPFFVALGCHLLVPGERLRPVQAAGLVCAFLGIVAAFGDALAFPDPQQLLGDLLALSGAFFWGATTLVVRTTSLIRASPDKTLAYQLGVSAAVLPVLSLMLGETGVTNLSPVVVLSVLYQAVVVAFASYLAWFWLMVRYPAPQLASFTFLTPLFGVAAGALLLGEPVGLGLFAAVALVCMGIHLVNRPPSAGGGNPINRPPGPGSDTGTGACGPHPP